MSVIRDFFGDLIGGNPFMLALALFVPVCIGISVLERLLT